MSNAALKIDLHIHTNVSDGTDSPEELLDIVKKEGIDVFSVTDHDAVKAALIINNIRRDGDPLFITGAEFSCKDENGKFLRRERYTGAMTRSFYVGKGLTEEDIKARFENGILSVSLPKEAPKKIEETKYISIE